MFRFHKALDVITLFHKPSLPASLRVLTLLKQISAQASETATEDQATDHTSQNKLQRTEFQLNVTEDPPTGDQLRTIIEYVGDRKASQIVEGARDASDAIHKLSQDINKFKAPVTVDWNNGRAGTPRTPDTGSLEDVLTTLSALVFGDNESEIMKMIGQLPKETDLV